MATRGKQKKNLMHVLDNVLQLSENHAMRRALKENGIDSMVDVIIMTKEELLDLPYWVNEEQDEHTTLRPHHVNGLVKAIQHWIIDLERDPNRWTDMTYQSYIQASTKSVSWEDGLGIPMTPTSPGGALSPGTNEAQSKKTTVVEQWDKSIKRDASQFPELTVNSKFPIWLEKATAIAKSQQCANVFDSEYVPTTSEEVELFQRQQVFVYGMMSIKLKTVKAKNLLKTYKETSDAQAILVSLDQDLNTGVHCRNIADTALGQLQEFSMSTTKGAGKNY